MNAPIRLVADVLPTAALAALAAVSLVHDGQGAAAWLVSAGLVLPLLLQRRAAGWALGLMCLAAAAQLVLGVRVVADLALFVGLFTVASRRPWRVALAAAGVLEAFGVAAALVVAPSRDGRLVSVLFLSGLVAAAFFAGIAAQDRQARLAALVERADRLERDHLADAERAVAAERTRIAREMHDIVAHSLSVMITLADGARASAGGDATPAGQAMGHVAATGRDAMDQMRRLLGVLREDAPGPLSPVPGLADVDVLVRESRAAGVPARLTTHGSPVVTSAALGAAVYRLVQEALTNVRKHATGSRSVEVSLRWNAGELEVAVRDDGRAATTGPPGHGMLGMRERVALFGGTLAVGPDPGGWRVDARFPLEPAGRP